jgi:hypothetical protein
VPIRATTLAATISALSLLLPFTACEQSRVAVSTTPAFTDRLDPVPGEVHLASDSVTLPATLCRNLFLVNVTVNGHGPFQMVLDTGATHSAVSQRVARALQPDVSATSVAVSGARGDNATANSALRVRTLTSGDLSLGEFDALVLDFSPFASTLGERVQGILGYSAFEGLLLTLDYPKGEVRVSKSALKKDTPHTLASLRPTAPLVRARVGDRSIRVLLDSGLDGLIDLADVDDSDFQAAPVPVSNSHTIGGTAIDYAGRLKSDITLGDITLRQPIVSRIAEDNLFGAELLRHFVVTFDRKSRLVRLDPAGETNTPLTFPALKGIGVAFTHDRDFGSQISHVFPGSTAEAAGLKVGDIPIRFNGRRRGEYRCTPTSQLLGAGSSIKIDVIRDRRERMSFDVPIGTLVP